MYLSFSPFESLLNYPSRSLYSPLYLGPITSLCVCLFLPQYISSLPLLSFQSFCLSCIYSHIFHIYISSLSLHVSVYFLPLSILLSFSPSLHFPLRLHLPLSLSCLSTSKLIVLSPASGSYITKEYMTHSRKQNVIHCPVADY